MTPLLVVVAVTWSVNHRVGARTMMTTGQPGNGNGNAVSLLLRSKVIDTRAVGLEPLRGTAPFRGVGVHVRFCGTGANGWSNSRA
jgi:hypothetical protein